MSLNCINLWNLYNLCLQWFTAGSLCNAYSKTLSNIRQTKKKMIWTFTVWVTNSNSIYLLGKRTLKWLDTLDEFRMKKKNDLNFLVFSFGQLFYFIWIEEFHLFFSVQKKTEKKLWFWGRKNRITSSRTETFVEFQLVWMLYNEMEK